MEIPDLFYQEYHSNKTVSRQQQRLNVGWKPFGSEKELWPNISMISHGVCKGVVYEDLSNFL